MQTIANLPIPSVEHVMRVTLFKDKATAEAAIKTLRWFDSGAPKVTDGIDGNMFFNMSTFQANRKNWLLSNDEDKQECGTVCCIAGAIQMYKNDGRRLPIWEREIAIVFGFDNTNRYDPLNHLFYPWRLGDEGDGDIVPRSHYNNVDQVSRTFRKYLFTGQTDWNA